MNYIQKLEQEKKALLMQIWDTQEMLLEVALYLSSEKFQSVQNDYVHVSTDIRPKLLTILNKVRQIESNIK